MLDFSTDTGRVDSIAQSVDLGNIRMVVVGETCNASIPLTSRRERRNGESMYSEMEVLLVAVTFVPIPVRSSAPKICQWGAVFDIYYDAYLQSSS